MNSILTEYFHKVVALDVAVIDVNYCRRVIEQFTAVFAQMP